MRERAPLNYHPKFFEENFKLDYEKNIEQILLPRQFKENFYGNEREIDSTQYERSSTIILNTDNTEDIDLQVELLNRSKKVFVTDGSPYLVNGCFCRNSDIVIVSNPDKRQLDGQIINYCRTKFIDDYIKKSNTVEFR